MIATRFNPLGKSFAKLTAQSYVQTGLLSQWDAIENVGYGEHDNSANVWKDLVGGIDLTARNNKYLWEETFVRLNDSGFSNDALYYTYLGKYTIETVFAFDDDRVGDAIASIFSSGHTTTRKLTQMAVSRQTPPTFIFGGGDVIKDCFDMTPYKGVFVSVAMNAKRNTIYRNGVNVTGERTGLFARNGTNIGTHIGYGYTTMYGRICAVRVYDSDLTDAELAHNYAIDKERFGL